MFYMFWPLVLAVLSNILYNISSKSLPPECSPWATLVVTYLTASFLSFMAYYIFDNNREFIASILKINWTGFTLGISMVGLEIGYIFIYRAGWKISIASLLSNVILAVALMLIGIFVYKEKLGIREIAGICFCVTGCLFLMFPGDK